MQVECSSCGARYKLRDDKKIERKTVVRCKNCQETITITPEESKPPKSSPSNEGKITIECPQCNTRYKISENRLTQGRMKVKCSNCDHQFVVEKQSEPKSNIKPPTSAEKAYLEATSLEDEGAGESADLGFSDQQKSDFFLKPGKIPGKEALLKEQNQAKAPKKHATTEEFDEEDSTELPDDPFDGADEPEDSLDQQESMEFDSELSDAPEPSQAPEREPTPSFQAPEAKSPWMRMMLVNLVVLVFFLATVGGGVYLVLTDHPIVLSLMGKSVHKLEMVETLQSKQVLNLPSRKQLIVLETSFRNQFDTADKVSWVQFKGIALDGNGKVIETTVAYAGNVLSREELATMSLSKIREFYKYNAGRNQSNFELLKGTEVPVQIVFFNAEGRLKDAKARIVSYVRNDKTVYVQYND